MIYEIVNPSDPITIEADDLVIAQVATIILGRGRYGLTDESGNEVLPLFLFGGFDQWAKKNQFDVDKIMKERWAEIADCLETTVVVGISERRAILAAVGSHGKEAIERFNDERRSSMNDISGYAHKIAERIREQHRA
jgi:hypothetical protein